MEGGGEGGSDPRTRSASAEPGASPPHLPALAGSPASGGGAGTARRNLEPPRGRFRRPGRRKRKCVTGGGPRRPVGDTSGGRWRLGAGGRGGGGVGGDQGAAAGDAGGAPGRPQAPGGYGRGHHRARHVGGGGAVPGVRPLPEAHHQDDHQRGAPAAEAAGQVHLQLGGDGAAEGHGAAPPVLHAAHRQEHHGLHPLRGRGGEPQHGPRLPGAPGRPDHQAQRLLRHPQGAGRRVQDRLPHPPRLGLLLPRRRGHERDAAGRAARHHPPGGAALQVVRAPGGGRREAQRGRAGPRVREVRGDPPRGHPHARPLPRGDDGAQLPHLQLRGPPQLRGLRAVQRVRRLHPGHERAARHEAHVQGRGRQGGGLQHQGLLRFHQTPERRLHPEAAAGAAEAAGAGAAAGGAEAAGEGGRGAAAGGGEEAEGAGGAGAGAQAGGEAAAAGAEAAGPGAAPQPEEAGEAAGGGAAAAAGEGPAGGAAAAAGPAQPAVPAAAHRAAGPRQGGEAAGAGAAGAGPAAAAAGGAAAAAGGGAAARGGGEGARARPAAQGAAAAPAPAEHPAEPEGGRPAGARRAGRGARRPAAAHAGHPAVRVGRLRERRRPAAPRRREGGPAEAGGGGPAPERERERGRGRPGPRPATRAPGRPRQRLPREAVPGRARLHPRQQPAAQGPARRLRAGRAAQGRPVGAGQVQPRAQRGRGPRPRGPGRRGPAPPGRAQRVAARRQPGGRAAAQGAPVPQEALAPGRQPAPAQRQPRPRARTQVPQQRPLRPPRAEPRPQGQLRPEAQPPPPQPEVPLGLPPVPGPAPQHLGQVMPGEACPVRPREIGAHGASRSSRCLGTASQEPLGTRAASGVPSPTTGGRGLPARQPESPEDCWMDSPPWPGRACGDDPRHADPTGWAGRQKTHPPSAALTPTAPR